MKNILKLILLLFVLCVTPVYGNTGYTLKVNNILYNLDTPFITKNDTLYIAADGLAKITFGTLTEDKASYTLSIQDMDISITPNQLNFIANSTAHTLSAAPFLSEGTLYVPVDLLKAISYPVKIDEARKIVSIDCPTPYSRNVDTPSKHQFITSDNHLTNLPTHVVSLSDEKLVKEAIDYALDSKSYISFLDSSNKNKIADFIRSRISYSPYNNIKVSFRVINTHTYPNEIVDTTTLPLKIGFSGNNLVLNLGKERIDYPMYWATFYPKHDLNTMDLNKSFDVTLMHALYEHFRNASELKDDKYFSPFMLISSERTNEMLHKAYSTSFKFDDSLNEYESTYTIRVSRVHPSGMIHYIVDIIGK